MKDHTQIFWAEGLGWWARGWQTGRMEMWVICFSIKFFHCSLQLTFVLILNAAFKKISFLDLVAFCSAVCCLCLCSIYIGREGWGWWWMGGVGLEGI